MQYILSHKNPNVKNVFDNATQEMREIFKSGKDVSVTVEIATKKRSSLQNRMFHAIVGLLSDETGYTEEEIKDYIMKDCGFSKEVIVKNQLKNVRMSTTSLTPNEFNEIIEKALNICEFRDIKVPDKHYIGD